MSNDKSPKKTIDLNKYEDPTDLAPKNLELGLWIASNRKLIYKIIVIILATLAAIFLLYSGYGYIHYFIVGQEQDKALQQNNSGLDLANYRLQNKPADLLISQPKVIANNNGSDFIVHLKNSNDKQSANFDYCFTAGGNQACGTGFILPNEEKNLLLINSTVKAATGVADFKLTSITWQKLKAGEIPDWNAFRDQRFNFSITEPKFSSYDGNVNYLEFNITNNSSYNYFEVPLNMVVLSGNEALAVNRFIIEGLNSQETKSIRLSWPEAVNLGGTIKVTPELNLLDSSIYRPYSSN